MTIKQQGGIFGRNPTFNDVEVNDISLPDAGEASFGDSNDLKIYHSGSQSYIQENGVGSLLIYGSNMRLGNSDGSKLYLLANSGDKTDIYFDGAVKIRTQSTGAQIFGDLAFSSGNGIDFSATSGTGTSELFDDYEEGTWTPSVSGFDGTATVSGSYTKIGNRVFLEFSIGLDGTSDGSAYNILGLPFAPASTGGGYISSTDSGYTSTTFVSTNSSNALLLKDSSNASINFNTFGNASTTTFVAFYKT